MSWTYEFEEDGGYDCMTSAFHIRDNNKLVVVVDCADFGEPRCANDGDRDSIKAKLEAEKIARLITKAPEMAELLKKIRDVVGYSWVQDEVGQLLAEIEGEAKP